MLHGKYHKKCFTEIHTKLDKNQAMLIVVVTRLQLCNYYVLLWCSSGVPSLTNEWRQRVSKVFQISRAIRDLKYRRLHITRNTIMLNV